MSSIYASSCWRTPHSLRGHSLPRVSQKEFRIFKAPGRLRFTSPSRKTLTAQYRPLTALGPFGYLQEQLQQSPNQDSSSMNPFFHHPCTVPSSRLFLGGLSCTLTILQILNPSCHACATLRPSPRQGSETVSKRPGLRSGAHRSCPAWHRSP